MTLEAKRPIRAVRISTGNAARSPMAEVTGRIHRCTPTAVAEAA